MAWTIEFSPKALREMQRIAKSDATRIRDFLSTRIASRKDPRELAKQLAGEVSLWRFRVGDYRIIVRFEDKTLVIIVIDVGHRSSIYQR